MPWRFRVARYRYRRAQWGETNRLVVGSFAALLAVAVVVIIVRGL